MAAKMTKAKATKIREARSEARAAYVEIKTALPEARRVWAAAEIAWAACANPRFTGMTPPECNCGDCGPALVAAADDVAFLKGLAVACGEVITGVSFEENMRRFAAAEDKEIP